MPLIHTYDGTDLTDAVQLTGEGGGFAASAKLGQAEIIQVTVDDPSGVRAFTGHKVWKVRESACAAGNQVVWYGFVGDKTITRGPYRTGVERVWELQLVEVNTFIKRRVLRPTDTPNRPSETVSARVAWLQTTVGFTGGLIVDHGLIEASSVTLDPRDYLDQTGLDVLNDCALASGFNFWIRYREASDDLELAFLASDTSILDQSSLLISNDLADVDFATGWAANPDANIMQIVERVASGVALPYSGGSSVYGQDAATEAAFASIDLVAPTASVTTASTANTLLTHLLDQHSTEEEKVDNLWIELPEANLNDVKHGQLIRAKFTHGPGWESFRPARVIRKVFSRLPNTTEDKYRVSLELQPAAPVDYVSTAAQLMDPSKGGLSELGYIGGGTYKPVHHLYDGDAPFPGGTLYPLTGLIEYIGSAGNRTGLRVLGSGTVTVTLAFSCSKVTSGGITFTAVIYNNASTQATFPHSVNDMGLTTYGWEPIHGTSLVTSFDVVSGDELTWSIHNNSNDVLSALPTGVGNVDHWFRVTGLLAA